MNALARACDAASDPDGIALTCAAAWSMIGSHTCIFAWYFGPALATPLA